jgi:ribosomal protein S12 methylthiotransferase accessory factor
MGLHDSFKQYRDGGMSKLVPPDETVDRVLTRIGCMKYPILDFYREVKRPSGIPQFVFAVNDNFRRFKARVANTNGKGHTPAQAMASGLMEMAERYSCFKYIAFRNGNIARIARFADIPENVFTVDSLASIVAESHARVAPEVENALIAFYEGSTLDGRPALLPLNLLNYFVTTNGMAAGNSLEEALVHAVCEVIERHCLAMIRLRKTETPLIDHASITNPVAIELLRLLSRDGQRVIIRDFSLGLGMPVIGVIRIIDTNNCLVTAGVATHSDEALIRALTENSQGDHSVLYEDLSSSGQYLAETEQAPIDSIPCIDHTNYRIELENIGTLLEKRDMAALYVEATDAELDIPSVIAVITNAKKDHTVPSTKPSDFCCALSEESLFLENYEQAARYIALGKSYQPDNGIFPYYEALCFAFRKKFSEAVECFECFRNSGHLNSFFQQRILANTALCLFMTGRADEADEICRHLSAIDSNPVFNWQESWFPVLSKEVTLFRRRVLFSHLERIRLLCESGSGREMSEAIQTLLKLNVYCGLLFNQTFLAALAYMTIDHYEEALKFLFLARKSMPEEVLYDELIARCRKAIAENDTRT